MKFGVVIPTYGRFGTLVAIDEIAAAAEALGFDSVWLGDHVVTPAWARHLTDPHWYDALTVATHVLARTTRIEVGTDVLVLPYRNPLVLASQVATASELSAGRLVLGVGVGFLSGEFEALGVPPYADRGRVTDEYLAVLRRLLSADGEPVSFAGRWVRFEDVCFGPHPTAGVRLLVGGNHRRALARAIRSGDGWHPLWPSPAAYAAGRDAIREHRDGDGFEFSYSCPLVSLLAEGQAPPAATHHHGDLGPDYGYVPPLPERGGRTMFVGDPEQVAGDVRALADVGVTQIVLRFWIPSDELMSPADHIEQMRRFSTEVRPRLGFATAAGGAQ